MATPPPKHIIEQLRKTPTLDSIIRKHIENSIENEHPMFQSFVKNHSIFFGESPGKSELEPDLHFSSHPYFKPIFQKEESMSSIEVGDEIEFCVNGKCLNYKVARSEEAVFLSNHTKPSQLEYENISPTNASIFEELGFDINEYEHYRWCRKIYGYSPVNKDTDKIDFPEAKNLEDLQRVIQDLEVMCNEKITKNKAMRKVEKVKIEDLHIGQTVYLHGEQPGEIILINGEEKNIVVSAANKEKHRWHIWDITLSPEFNFSDWETVHKLHREIWNWLETHPECEKEDWPRWKRRGGDVPNVANLCFYCEYARSKKQEGESICSNCPGDWKIDAKENHDDPPCVRGIYGIWIESKHTDKKRRTAAQIIKNS